jgi:hypothetical protein
MKMTKKSKRLSILLGAMLGCFLVALIMLYAASSAPEREFLRIPAYGLLGAGFVPLGFALYFAIKDAVQNGKRRKEYLTYPVNEITDFKREIDAIRANFESDTDKDKNRVLKGNYANVASWAKPYYDQNVVKCGKVYYGALVQANDKLFKKTRLFPVLPGVVVYGTDGYFESNPADLKEIAERLFAEKGSNVLQYERQFFSNMRLPLDKTNGRDVYMTTVMISREHLPQYCLQSGLFPVIAAPDKSTSVFIVDCKYWTKDLIANFIRPTI